MSDFIRSRQSRPTCPILARVLVEVDEHLIALFHVGGKFYAIDDVCTHDGGPLADGELEDHTIACPRHGAKFDIRTGRRADDAGHQADEVVRGQGGRRRRAGES